MRFLFTLTLLVMNARAFPGWFPQVSVAASQMAVILILDNSGSMKTSDPDGLRFTGARLFLSLLDPADAAGVIVFSTKSTSLTGSLFTIQSGEDKLALINQIGGQAPDGFTDVKTAFQAVGRLLDSFQLDGRATYLVFLTDGKPEIQNPYAGYEEETLEAAKQLHVPVLAIALTSSAQTPFLDQLVTETGGQVIPADTALDLTDAYLNVLSQIKDRTVLTTTRDDTSFFVDSGLAPYIDSASFIAARTRNEPVYLYSPFGEVIRPTDQNVKFYLEYPEFVTIDVRNPSPGTWAFQKNTSRDFKAYAILHSRLRIEVDSPGNIHQQSKPLHIAVRMTEELPDGKRVPILGDATFTAVVTLPDGTQASLDLFYDDGTHGDVLAGDGIFSRLFVNTEQTGTYTIQIRGQKANVQVEQLDKVTVIPFPEIILQQPVDTREFSGQGLQLRVLLEGAGNYSIENGSLIAVITSPSGLTAEISLTGNGKIYSGNYVPKQEGIHQIQISGKNTTYRGLPYQETVSSQFEVKFIRTLNIEAGEWNTYSCFHARGFVPLYLRVFSTQPETIRFHVSGVDGLQLNPPSIHSTGGSQEFLLQMSSPSETFPPGKYQFHLDTESSSEFEQQPMPADFSFEVPGASHRCGSVFRWGGLSGFVLVIAFLFIARKIHLDSMPPLISGTLRCWMENGSAAPSVQEHDLSLFSKPIILVGSASDSDIRISDHGLQDQYFALAANKTDNGIQVFLNPIGEIHRRYSRLHGPVVLQHGDIFRIEKLNFQYLSDSGE